MIRPTRPRTGAGATRRFAGNPAAYVTITPVLPPGDPLMLLMGEGPAREDPGGGGGWDVVERPKNKAFTTWNGYEPYRLSVPVMLDRAANDGSIEPEFEEIRRWMRVPRGATGHPTVLRVRGPVPMTQLSYVIESIELGDEIRRRDGQRVRAAMILRLLEFTPADVLISRQASPAKSAQRRAERAPKDAGQASGTTYTIKSGDTLWAIAARHLGSGDRWQEIASMNDIRDPRNLKVGTVLRLP